MWHYTFAIPSPPIHSLQWFAPDPQVASVEDQLERFQINPDLSPCGGESCVSLWNSVDNASGPCDIGPRTDGFAGSPPTGRPYGRTPVYGSQISLGLGAVGRSLSA